MGLRKILWKTNYVAARTGFDFPDRASARFYVERFFKYCKDEGVDGGTTTVLSKIEHAYELAFVEYNGKRLGMEFLLSSPAMGLAFDPSDEVQTRLFNNYVSSGGDYDIPEEGDYVNNERSFIF